jgi:UDP-N-acetylmuramyl tripeptide synthase
MSLSLFFSQDQVETIQKYTLQKDVENIIFSFENGVVDSEEAKQEILDLIDAKIEVLQDSLARDLKKTEVLNPFKMTTIDSWSLHRTLYEMYQNGCESVILELSSQGLEQNRHLGLNSFLITGFLNIFPEHIESHGSFENYINAKAKLFSLVKPKGFVIANDSKQLGEVLKYNKSNSAPIVIHRGVDYSISEYSLSMYKDFEFEDIKDSSHFIADFEVENAVFASKIVMKYLETTREKYNYNSRIIHKNYFDVPGRMEWVVVDNEIAK